MKTAEILDLTKVSGTFPDLPEPLVPRDNVLDLIDNSFARGFEVFCLEGPEGRGKTVTAAQFAKRHPDHAFTLFLRTTSRWGYDPDFVRQDLIEQLRFRLRKERKSSEADAEVIGTLLHQLRRDARRHNYSYYFVVDGLAEIPRQQHHLREAILELLPLGFVNCRF